MTLTIFSFQIDFAAEIFFFNNENENENKE